MRLMILWRICKLRNTKKINYLVLNNHILHSLFFLAILSIWNVHNCDKEMETKYHERNTI